MKNTTKWIGITLTLLFIATSCNSNLKKTDTISLTDKNTPTMEIVKTDKTLLAVDSISAFNISNTDAATLFDQKCMICHITKGKTAETMLAPPFYEVKKRYLKASMGKADFIEIMNNWVKKPSADNILIPDAVAHFGIMPNLNYTEEDINQISQYIYDTDMPKPDWFDAHEAEHLEEHKTSMSDFDTQGND